MGSTSTINQIKSSIMEQRSMKQSLPATITGCTNCTTRNKRQPCRNEVRFMGGKSLALALKGIKHEHSVFVNGIDRSAANSLETIDNPTCCCFNRRAGVVS